MNINIFEVGEAVRVMPGAKFCNGKDPSPWVYETKLFVRENLEDGVIVAKRTSGTVTGMFNESDLMEWVEDTVDVTFEPYVVRIIAEVADIHAGAGNKFKKTGELKKNYLNTIVGEKDGWGRLKVGGWIDLAQTVKR